MDDQEQLSLDAITDITEHHRFFVMVHWLWPSDCTVSREDLVYYTLVFSILTNLRKLSVLYSSGHNCVVHPRELSVRLLHSFCNLFSVQGFAWHVCTAF